MQYNVNNLMSMICKISLTHAEVKMFVFGQGFVRLWAGEMLMGKLSNT